MQSIKMAESRLAREQKRLATEMNVPLVDENIYVKSLWNRHTLQDPTCQCAYVQTCKQESMQSHTVWLVKTHQWQRHAITALSCSKKQVQSSNFKCGWETNWPQTKLICWPHLQCTSKDPYWYCQRNNSEKD